MGSHPPTRAYVARRAKEGLSKPEIIRCARRISDAIYAALVADARRDAAACPQGPGGQPGNRSVSRAAGSHPARRLFGQALPGLPPPYGPAPQKLSPQVSSTERFGTGPRTLSPI